MHIFAALRVTVQNQQTRDGKRNCTLRGPGVGWLKKRLLCAVFISIRQIGYFELKEFE